MAKFEGYERREAKILEALKEYGINSIDECKEICDSYGIDPYKIVEETQNIKNSNKEVKNRDNETEKRTDVGPGIGALPGFDCGRYICALHRSGKTYKPPGSRSDGYHAEAYQA